MTPMLYDRATPQRKPWGHVPKDVRADLRGAYVAVLDAKVHASTAKDLPIPPAGPPDDTTHRACLMCGLAKQVEPWRVGGLCDACVSTKPDMVTGYLCSPCGDAVEAAGALGEPPWSARP